MSKLEKIECETIVNWNKEESFAVVYTRDKEVMKKLDQMCSRYPETYELPKKQILISTTRFQRAMSDFTIRLRIPVRPGKTPVTE